MKIRVTARHFELAPELKEYVEAKILRLAHYFDRVDEANVVFEEEGHRSIADVTVHAARAVVSSEQSADDFRLAFDRALEKVERQIRRYKERMRDRKHGDATAAAAAAAGGIAPGEVGIVPEKLESTGMNAEEALAQLDEMNARFLVFLNTETDKINVIYRRDDGNYGLVEPED
jgi:putative sigma-54 modulation protein